MNLAIQGIIYVTFNNQITHKTTQRTDACLTKLFFQSTAMPHSFSGEHFFNFSENSTRTRVISKICTGQSKSKYKSTKIVLNDNYKVRLADFVLNLSTNNLEQEQMTLVRTDLDTSSVNQVNQMKARVIRKPSCSFGIGHHHASPRKKNPPLFYVKILQFTNLRYFRNPGLISTLFRRRHGRFLSSRLRKKINKKCV